MKNILTIDIEEVFHAEYARQYYNYDIKYRTPKNIQIVLNLLSAHNVEATFFVVGEIAEKFPEVLKMIDDQGHEIAFHGWSHISLHKLSPEEF
ncbi:MAG: polysaccharide deacetylase family protein, partial [Candidatus Bathyarchaeota archaeon]|nr:polysaccharide deacetylase family protein [Candidatus Bathyarchaeota archaeon]